MITPHKVISLLEKDNSRLGKESVLERESRANNVELFKGIRLSLDNMITFGVKQVPIKTGFDGKGLNWETFEALCLRLSTRRLTGNDARDKIDEAMALATFDEWNGWYRRILIKDLRCGVSEKTVNKVALATKKPQFEIPVFTCQLAKDSTDHQEKLKGVKQIETKLDGVRVLTIVYPNGRVIQMSRNGKELENFPEIKKQFSRVAASLPEPWVFDGEVMSASFQDLMKQVHRKSDVKTADATLYLFDIIPLSDFEDGFCSTTQEVRTESLKMWYNDTAPFGNIQILDSQNVDFDTSEGRDTFLGINKKALDGGYEGIMIKDLSAPYECKRSTSWMKLKPFIELSLEVVAVEEGTGKNLGSLGAIVCEGVDSGKKIKVNVGSGFSDEERANVWENRDTVIGNIAEVRADAITQNQDGTYSLRFPRFKSWRGFVVGEKI